MTKSRNVKVMLADDDEDDRDLFKEAISSQNTDLTTAINGKDLIKKLGEQQNLPDCVFLDLNMPEKNGKECLVEIRRHPKLKYLPVIIYSTSTNSRDIDETLALGANLYVVKPGSFKMLCDTLAKIVSIDWKDYPTMPAREKFLFSMT